MALMAQVTEGIFQEEPSKYKKKIKNVLKQLLENPELYPYFSKLKFKLLKLPVNSNISNGRSDDKSFQIVYFIFLYDTNCCHPLHWSSYESKRVARFVLGSEVMSFADAFDVAYTIGYEFQRIFQRAVRLPMPTDSLSLIAK